MREAVDCCNCRLHGNINYSWRISINFQMGFKVRHVSQAAQQLLILEGKLNFCIMSDEDSLKDIEVIQETMLDIAKV